MTLFETPYNDVQHGLAAESVAPAIQVENIGVQIEQPFEVLPLPHFCAAIKKHILDMVSCHAEAKALALQSHMTPSPSQMASTFPCSFLPCMLCCACCAVHSAVRLRPSS